MGRLEELVSLELGPDAAVDRVSVTIARGRATIAIEGRMRESGSVDVAGSDPERPTASGGLHEAGGHG